jgi:hypothetical protein
MERKREKRREEKQQPLSRSASKADAAEGRWRWHLLGVQASWSREEGLRTGIKGWRFSVCGPINDPLSHTNPSVPTIPITPINSISPTDPASHRLQSLHRPHTAPRPAPRARSGRDVINQINAILSSSARGPRKARGVNRGEVGESGLAFGKEVRVG